MPASAQTARQFGDIALGQSGQLFMLHTQRLSSRLHRLGISQFWSGDTIASPILTASWASLVPSPFSGRCIYLHTPLRFPLPPASSNGTRATKPASRAGA